MRAALKGLHSPDIDIDYYYPDDEDEFYFLLQAMIGPDDEDGADTFNIVVCSPKWLLLNPLPEGIMVGVHKLIVMKYDIAMIRAFIHRLCQRQHGNSWQEIASNLHWLGEWEFHNYDPSSHDTQAGG